MNGTYCPTCNKFIGRGHKHHRCPPLWRVLIAPDDEHHTGDDKPTLIRAQGAQCAAIEFIRQWDQNDCDFIATDGASIAVLVSSVLLNTPLQRFTVTGEWSPYYTTTEEQTP